MSEKDSKHDLTKSWEIPVSNQPKTTLDMIYGSGIVNEKSEYLAAFCSNNNLGIG